MDQPAITGGNPVRTKPFPSWPPADDAIAEAVAQTVRDGVWGSVDGPRKLEFERRYAEFHDAKHGLGVSNGTVSLQIALSALGVGSGDEVIVPAYTFLATATAVLAINALPVFVDVDADTVNIDPDAVEAAITPRTKAIIPVHFAGQPADLDRLTAIAQRHDLAIIEDAAHAHGASWKGRKVGAIGDFGSWSFQASKNFTSGEGGALTTNDDRLHELAWSLHNCGRQRDGIWYEHTVLGGNHRITELQATLLLHQLDGLDALLDRRERSAAILNDGLGAIEGLRPMTTDPRVTRHGYHLYQLRYDEPAFGLPRERFTEAMRAEGIPIGGGYPVPLYRQPVFAKGTFDQRATGYDSSPIDYAALDLPVSEALCSEALWITQNVLLGTDEDMADVVTAAQKVRHHFDGLRS